MAGTPDITFILFFISIEKKSPGGKSYFINHVGMIIDRYDDLLSLKGHLAIIIRAIGASRHAG
jgi:hypothetical protein